MIIFIYGLDTFRSRQYLNKIMTKFKVDRDPNGYNVVTLDAEIVTSAGAIISEMFATPFLAEKRMVIVKNLLSAKSVEARQQISDIIKNNRLPSSTVAVFWERAETYKNKDSKALLELLQKEKYQERFSLLTLSEAATWFRSLSLMALQLPWVCQKLQLKFWALIPMHYNNWLTRWLIIIRE